MEEPRPREIPAESGLRKSGLSGLEYPVLYRELSGMVEPTVVNGPVMTFFLQRVVRRVPGGIPVTVE